ncbi:LysR family transcriptional regulator [Marmoricola sp. URHB0036]|uniref:LysR family transcriptional regulator n=1 Tax=Marmoricola sp. URHB0036 TaxID=1298863 RepID=UPI00040BE6AC|nr:LysR family transcriptional regulator [Marmoricola sp. URHB0036]
MTPTQLRAFACVVRRGSVKAAAAELGTTESAVSMNLKQLRTELDDPLFTRTPSGLAYTPGGLRLASRAMEILDLQSRTVLEVSEAGAGRRMLRLASSGLFAEHAAPGLIGLFTNRARDLDVELSVHPVTDFADLLFSRTVDVALGPGDAHTPRGVVQQPFLAYDVGVVAAPEHPVAVGTVGLDQLADQVWLLGPGATELAGETSAVLRRLRVPEKRQRIFQSDAAALGETRRGMGLAIAVGFTVRDDLRNGRLVRIEAPELTDRGSWSTWTLARDQQISAAAELVRFVGTPRATQAMLRGEAAGVGRFRPAVHVTLWS